MVLDKRLPLPSRNDHRESNPQPAVEGAPSVGAARPLTFAQMNECPPVFCMEAAHQWGAPAADTIRAVAMPEASTLDRMISRYFKRGPKNLQTPQVFLGNKGTTWTDLLGASNYNNCIDFLIIEKVFRTLEVENIRTFETRKVEFKEIPKKKLKELPRPDYYTLEAPESSKPRIKTFHNGEKRGSQPVVWRWKLGRKFMRGEDIIIGKHMAFCTVRFIELAREHSWSNFKFSPLDSVRVRRIGQELLDPLDVDYHGAEWPPKQWYPDRHFELAAQCNETG